VSAARPADVAGPAGLGRSSEHAQFASALHSLLSGGTSTARRWAAGDYAPGLELWRGLAGLGVTALAVPQRHGGLGATPLDLVVACEEIGHHALPGPAAESLAAVPVLLAALASEPGSEPDSQRWLAGLVRGDFLATLAAPPWLPFAADAGQAGLVLLAEAGTVVVAQPGARHRSVDPARSLSQARGVRPLGSGPGAAAGITEALRFGVLASAAQLLGAGRALLEASVAHARQRTQFGRPVGSFQAVKHQLADVAIALEFARPLLDAAAAALAGQVPGSPAGTSPPGTSPAGAGKDTGGAGKDAGGAAGSASLAARDVSAAKVACADAAYLAARVALQVHGAIGYAAEHDLSLWLTKVRALVAAWGTPAEHRAIVLAAITEDGGSR
jgi:alkylation response protein AidB-like acyl-CoA dehydrogenase